MKPLTVVELEVPFYPCSELVHADADLSALQHPDERVAAKLTSLVGIENRRLSVAGKRLFECFDSEASIQGIRQPPAQYLAAVQIHNCHQVHMPTGQADVRQVAGPHLVRITYLFAPQQVRIVSVPLRCTAQVPARKYRM